jgi:hypothetical protein
VSRRYNPPVDYLLIGHVCRDLLPDGDRLGGTVTFGALTAKKLGLQPAIVTSAPDQFERLLSVLDGIPLARIPSEKPTTFENIYTPEGRQQTVQGFAERLYYDHIPPGWRRSPIVHLAPVIDEVPPDLVSRFPQALVGITPQGWLRGWDAQGHVFSKPWRPPRTVLQQIGALVFSIEDVGGNEALVREYAGQMRVLVVTRGSAGCTLFANSERMDIPAPQVAEVDPTGAGDIFAVAFFTHLRRTADPARSAVFATWLASMSVTRAGLASIPTPEDIQRALERV